MRAPCRMDGCGKESRGRGLCATHWLRWRQHGDPSVVKRSGVDFNVAARCEVDGCDRKSKARRMCSMHYDRWSRHGDPSVVLPKTGAPLKGEFPGWAAVHKRLERQRGSASEQTCADCGGPAKEWSYNGGDPEQLTGKSGRSMLAYSLDLANYDARCVRCHRIRDIGKRTHGADHQPPGAHIVVTALT